MYAPELKFSQKGCSQCSLFPFPCLYTASAATTTLQQYYNTQVSISKSLLPFSKSNTPTTSVRTLICQLVICS